jgi:hypothetical protein
MIVRELLVRLGVIADPGKVKDFDGAIDDLKANMGALVSVSKQVVAVGAAVGAAFGLQAVATASATIEIERQAAALGLSTDAYQEWKAAVGAFGVDTKDLADGFGQVAQVIGNAQDGADNAVKTFKSLNIEIADLKGKSVEEVFYLIADGIQATTDSGDRLRAANTLLGEQLARQLLPLLVEGSAGLDAYRRRARELGGVLDRDAIDRGREAAQVFAQFRIVTQGLRNELGLAFLPLMTHLATIFVEVAAGSRGWIGQRMEVAVRRISEALETLTRHAEEVDVVVRERFGGWANILERVKSVVVLLATAQAWRTLVSAITAVRAGFVALTATGGLLAGASFATVLGWAVALAAALVALYLVVDDLWTYFRGGESVIGDFLAGSERARATLAALGDAARAAGLFLSSLWLATRTYSAIVMSALGPALPYLQKLADIILTGLGNQALASLRAFTTGMRFAAEAIAFVAITVQELMRVLDGQLSFSAMLESISDRTGSLVFEGRKALDQGIMSLPGIGALTGGDMPAGYVPPSRPAVYVPNAAPFALQAGSATPSVTTNSVGGNTNNYFGLSTRDIEELQYREGLVQGRQLAALAGTGF